MQSRFLLEAVILCVGHTPLFLCMSHDFLLEVEEHLIEHLEILIFFLEGLS